MRKVSLNRIRLPLCVVRKQEAGMRDVATEETRGALCGGGRLSQHCHRKKEGTVVMA